MGQPMGPPGQAMGQPGQHASPYPNAGTVSGLPTANALETTPGVNGPGTYNPQAHPRGQPGAGVAHYPFGAPLGGQAPGGAQGCAGAPPSFGAQAPGQTCFGPPNAPGPCGNVGGPP